MDADWNWLEWVHHTSRDMSLHTETSYDSAMAALLNASHVLAEAWEDGYKAGVTGRDADGLYRKNPYTEAPRESPY